MHKLPRCRYTRLPLIGLPSICHGCTSGDWALGAASSNPVELKSNQSNGAGARLTELSAWQSRVFDVRARTGWEMLLGGANGCGQVGALCWLRLRTAGFVSFVWGVGDDADANAMRHL